MELSVRPLSNRYDHVFPLHDHLWRHGEALLKDPELRDVPLTGEDRIAGMAPMQWHAAVGGWPWQRVWALTDGEAIYGHAMLSGLGSPWLHHRAALSFGVEEDFRGRGWGRSLYRRAIAFAKESGLDYVDADALSTNESVISFHWKCGFVTTGHTPDFCRHGGRSYWLTRMTLACGKLALWPESLPSSKSPS